ncbi:MAG TPA: TonB family protein [Thermoanaerobaculia bacterium]|nr:TonB family protein [Thermoanaerobaculia bacterium]
MTDPQTRHTRGLLIVILLGVIFFALLALIILRTGGRKVTTGPRSETVTVLPLRIRIRTEANARAPVVATATSGEHLQMLEEQGAWVRVQTGDGLTGWAERVNLERTAERERRIARYQAIRKLPTLAGVTTDRAPLYAGPGIFYPLVGELPAGTSVHVFTRDHDFYAIDYNDQIAYADIDNVDVTASGLPQLNVATTSAPPTETVAPPPATPTPAPEPAPTAAAPAADVGIYSAVPAGGTQPEEIERVIPRYPTLARQANVGGSVVIRGVVRKDGSIDNVEIIKDLPYGLGEAAKEAVERWRFRPATYRGEPIDVYYTVTVNFRLR